MTTYYDFFSSPLGKIRLRASDDGLVGVDHVNQQTRLDPDWKKNPDHGILEQAIQELSEYFEGERTQFSTSLCPIGTAFQLEVWEALQTIPYGKTASYSDIGIQINKPKAVRAIGAANGRNPLSIFIPCHRIIGKNGLLTGYAGGLEQKKVLLDLEAASLKGF